MNEIVNTGDQTTAIILVLGLAVTILVWVLLAKFSN